VFLTESSCSYGELSDDGLISTHDDSKEPFPEEQLSWKNRDIFFLKNLRSKILSGFDIKYIEIYPDCSIESSFSFFELKPFDVADEFL